MVKLRNEELVKGRFAIFTSTWNHPDAFSTSPLVRPWIDFGMGEPRLRNVGFLIFDDWITSVISSSSSKRARIPISAARSFTLFGRPWPVVLKLTRRFAPERIVKSWPDGFRSRSSCSAHIDNENKEKLQKNRKLHNSRNWFLCMRRQRTIDGKRHTHKMAEQHA